MLLGKQTISFTILLILVFSANAQNGNRYRYHLDGDPQIRRTVIENGSIVINYSISEIDLQNITVENSDYYRLNIPGHIPSPDAGKPELPVFSNLISVPEGADYKIKISEVKTQKLRPSAKKIRGILYPAQESQVKRDLQEKRPFQIDRKIYALKGLIPADTVKIVSLGRMRNNHLANLYISPVRYNPRSNTLDVITSMKIEVAFSSSALPSLVSKSAGQTSVTFNKSLAKNVVNYNAELVPDFTNKPAGMIILTDTAFKKQLRPFLEWKTQKGFKIKVLYRGSGLAGNTYTELKETIAGIYRAATEDNPAPDYLLIIGDVNHIPYFGAGSTGNVTDMYYAEFDGNGDYFPELYTGRLPVKDTLELKSVIKKIIQYEKFQFAGENTFHSRALATVGSDAGFASYMNGQVKYSVSNYLTANNRINENHFYYPQPDLKVQKDSIIKLVNNGTSFINYTGHGDAAGWRDVNIKVADTLLLKNKNMYPFIISNACNTAEFNLPNSFGNRMVVEKDRGAIGFIGCSNESYWDEDFYWAVGTGTISDNPTYAGKGLGIFDRYFHTHEEFPADWYYTIGQINYAGNLAVSASTTIRKKYYWETYNVVGDPTIIPIIGRPDSFNISLPDTLPNGIKSLSLNVEPFCYAAISHFDTLWDASFGGSSGSVILDMPGRSNDSCLVVITGQNRYPLIKTIYFGEIKNEFLNLGSTTINDASGNNDKKADYGESMYLNLTLNNLGQTDANDVTAKITTGSKWLTVEEDSAFIGTMAPLSDFVLSDKLLIRVLDHVPDMSIASIDLTLKSRSTEKKYKTEIVLHSPKLEILNCTVEDTVLGNGDHIADPGETFNLIFRVRNQGSSDASGNLIVSSIADGLTIIQSNVKSGILKSDQITDIPVMVRLSDFISSGSYISVQSILNCDPFIMNKDFTFRIGKVRESFEASSFNVFPWINLSAVPWIITGASSFEGSISAKSGAIGHNGSSSLLLKTFYPAADTMKFYCKVSSEPNYDFLSFMLNGKEIIKKSGDVPWTKIVIPVPKGLNKMEWVYKKDVSVSGGADCAWIDMIDFAQSGSVNYIRKDLNVAKIESPVQHDQYGQEILSVKVLNSGKDLIDGFNLAYSLNNRMPVQQHFDNKVPPNGDTLTVAFRTKIDLSKYGIYNITAYGIDNDDDYIFNDTISLKVENKDINESLSIFPNPYRDQFTVFINSQINDRIFITLTNGSGSTFYSIEKDILSGENRIVISDTRIVPGQYYLTIRGKKINKTIPILKIIK